MFPLSLKHDLHTELKPWDSKTVLVLWWSLHTAICSPRCKKFGKDEMYCFLETYPKKAESGVHNRHKLYCSHLKLGGFSTSGYLGCIMFQIGVISLRSWNLLRNLIHITVKRKIQYFETAIQLFFNSQDIQVLVLGRVGEDIHITNVIMTSALHLKRLH